MSRPVFKRTLEVKPATFYNMLQVLEQREEGKRKTGRPANLTLKDQLVPPLLFWREYRTYHHMPLALRSPSRPAGFVHFPVERHMVIGSIFSPKQ